MTTRAVIADDEGLAREWIRTGIADTNVEIVAECADGVEAADAIRRLHPDLAFLDVEMPGIDGFGVLERLGEADLPAVIFITAYDQYAIRAFEAHAVDYLVKPFSHQRLREAVRRARLRIEGLTARHVNETLLALLEDIRRERGYPEWFLLKADGKSFFVRVDDIDWIESSRNNVILHVGPQTHVHHETTSGIEAKLDPKKFLRIHRSTIVNIERIKEIHPWFNGDYAITLRNGTRLTMTSTYRDRLNAFRQGTA
jgi:two-component system, LytTR family, response regulator